MVRSIGREPHTRNYGMTFYDATASDKWIPQTYEAVPWGWYPTAGDPNKTTKRVEIPELFRITR